MQQDLPFANKKASLLKTRLSHDLSNKYIISPQPSAADGNLNSRKKEVPYCKSVTTGATPRQHALTENLRIRKTLKILRSSPPLGEWRAAEAARHNVLMILIF
jgi:hypothetical protein